MRFLVKEFDSDEEDIYSLSARVVVEIGEVSSVKIYIYFDLGWTQRFRYNYVCMYDFWFKNDGKVFIFFQ